MKHQWERRRRRGGKIPSKSSRARALQPLRCRGTAARRTPLAWSQRRVHPRESGHIFWHARGLLSLALSPHFSQIIFPEELFAVPNHGSHKQINFFWDSEPFTLSVHSCVYDNIKLCMCTCVQIYHSLYLLLISFSKMNCASFWRT